MCLESEDLELFGSDPFGFLEVLRIWVFGLKLEIFEKNYNNRFVLILHES